MQWSPWDVYQGWPRGKLSNKRMVWESLDSSGQIEISSVTPFKLTSKPTLAVTCPSRVLASCHSALPPLFLVIPAIVGVYLLSFRHEMPLEKHLLEIHCIEQRSRAGSPLKAYKSTRSLGQSSWYIRCTRWTSWLLAEAQDCQSGLIHQQWFHLSRSVNVAPVTLDCEGMCPDDLHSVLQNWDELVVQLGDSEE